MNRPELQGCVAELYDKDNKLEVLVYEAHGQYHGYWRQGGELWGTSHEGGWTQCPRAYKSVMATIRACYVIAVHVKA